MPSRNCLPLWTADGTAETEGGRGAKSWLLCCWAKARKPLPVRCSRRCEKAPPKKSWPKLLRTLALRIARFPTTNEFGDWDTALHTFTFANAVHQGLSRTPSRELLRGVFDAAMSIHLDRFLNIPSTRLPEPDGLETVPEELLAELPVLLDERQRVDVAGGLVARYLYSGGD